MRRIFLKSFFLILSGVSFSQTNTFPSSGSVGIGTLSPTFKLDVRVSSPGDGVFIKSSNQSAALTLRGNGVNNGNWSFFALGDGDGWGGSGDLALYSWLNSPSYPVMYVKKGTGLIGMGANFAPSAQLHIVATNTAGLLISANNHASSTGLVVDHAFTGNYGYATLVNVQSDLTKAFAIQRISGGNATTVFQIFGNGVVNAKSVYAEALTVTPSAIGITYPDYVFNDKYKLMPIEELEKFILKNKHLPNVPSVDEVMKDGLNIYSINTALLEKVEELTLHIISLKKEIDELKLKSR